MSVVAKMRANQKPRLFPDVQQVDLDCVCDDRLFTINDPVPGRLSEGQTFSQASPQGNCRFMLPASEPVGLDEDFYLIFQERIECPPMVGALAVSKVRCMSVTDFGGTSKQVDVSSAFRPYDHQNRQPAPDTHPRQTWSFHLRMSIDNPAAAIQFRPGETTYWLGIYRARDFDLQDALADAYKS